MARVARFSLFMWLVFPSLACDQGAKAIARRVLEGGHPVELLDGLIRLQLAENPGAFLSLGATLPESARMLVFALLAPLALVVIAVMFLRSPSTSKAALCGVALMLGGGLGNVVDRVLRGAVVDFITVGAGSLRTGIFNLSDVAIVIGALLVVLGWTEPAQSTTGSQSPGGDARS